MESQPSSRASLEHVGHSLLENKVLPGLADDQFCQLDHHAGLLVGHGDAKNVTVPRGRGISAMMNKRKGVI